MAYCCISVLQTFHKCKWLQKNNSYLQRSIHSVILFIKDVESFWKFTSAINWCYVKRYSDWCGEPKTSSCLSMINKSFQPIQLTFTWWTGHVHPKNAGGWAVEWKHANHCQEPFWTPPETWNGFKKTRHTGRQSQPLHPSLLIGRAASCNVHSNAISGCRWEWHSGYNPFIGQTQVLQVDSYCVLAIHLPNLPSLVWPKRMKVVEKQETLHMWGFFVFVLFWVS